MSDSESDPHTENINGYLHPSLLAPHLYHTAWNELIIQRLKREGELTNFLQVNKATYTNATELYKQLLKKNVRLYSGIRDGNRLLGRALIMKAPDAVINIMLDQKPDEVSMQTQVPRSTRGLLLPLEIAIRQNYSLDIVRKIFWLTDDKIDSEWFMEQNVDCLDAAINHLYCNDMSLDGIEKSRQTVLFLLNVLPELISDAKPEYANRMLKDALFNGMESEVMCKILKLNDKLLDEIDINGDTILLLILRKSDVDNYINVLNMMATISKKKGINCIGKKNKKGDDALKIARNKNCSGAVINSLCGFYNFSNALVTKWRVELLDYVSYRPSVTGLFVNFATYTIIGKMNETAVLRILSEYSKQYNHSMDNLVTESFDDHKPTMLYPSLNHSLLSMAINAKYGFDVITKIFMQFPSAIQLHYTRLVSESYCIINTKPFHDLLYARLEYTLLQRDIRRHDIPDVESYRRLYTDRIVQPSLDKTEWHTMFYRLLGEDSLDDKKKVTLRHDIATTFMFWMDDVLYPLECVVRLGLALTYVKTLYEAYPEAIEQNNYAVIFHSLRCRNNDTSYEDVILFLLEKLNGTSKFDSNEAPWYRKTPLLIAEQQFWVDSGQQSTIWPRSRDVINAINKKFPHI